MLRVAGFRGTESMSQLFRFELDALAESSRRISFDALPGQRLGVQIQLPHSPARVFWGICSRITQGARNTGFTRFELDLVPHLRLLTRRGGFRIFQDVSVQQALEQSLAGQRASFELRASYEPHEMLVQYRETDFAYVSRLMEDEGIFYFFRHAADGDELVLADGPQSYSDRVACGTTGGVPATPSPRGRSHRSLQLGDTHFATTTSSVRGRTSRGNGPFRSL